MMSIRRVFQQFAFFLTISILLIPAPSFSQFIEQGVKDGIGIRAMGMGSAFTAVADDGTAVFYNPAGLGSLGIGYETGDLDVNSVLNQSNRYTTISLGSAGYASWTKSSTSETVDVISYGVGRFGGRGTSWGIAYKTISASLTGGKTVGFSSDFGMLVRITKDLNVGMLIQDIAESSSITVPTALRVGASLRPLKKAITIAADVEPGGLRSSSFLYHLGLEVQVAEGLKLRGGLHQGRMTAGAGFDFPLLQLEYAYINDARTARGLHLFGGKWVLFPPKTRPFSIIRPPELALIHVGGSLVGGGDDASIFGGYKLGADAVLTQIKRASKDPAIDGIYLRIRGMGGGLGLTGIVQELRSELKRAKLAGKKIVAYLEAGAVGDEYYLASIADSIVAPSGAHIGGIGKNLVIQRIKGLTDKIGIEMQVLAKGKYKDSFDQFREGPSPEQKKMLQSVITDTYQQMVSDIAVDRDIPKEQIREIADGRILTTKQAKELGLIDVIAYQVDALKEGAELVGKPNEEPQLVPPDELISATPDEVIAGTFNRIAVIEVDGEITTGENTQNILFGGRTVGSDTVVKEIDNAMNDPYVKALIVRINSPGGSPVGSAHVYSKLMQARDKGKFVVASMGNVAASGGYYIAAASDKILADPSSLTGSIGVIGNIPVLAEVYKKLGITSEVYKEGEHADMFSGIRKFSAAERKAMMDLLDESYKDFVNSVAVGRKMKTSEVEAIAEGRVYTGNQAIKIGLVDKLGSFSDAVDVAADATSIRGEPQLVFYRRSPSFLYQLGMATGAFLGLPNNLFRFLGGPPHSELTDYRLRW